MCLTLRALPRLPLFQPDEWRRTTEGPEHSVFALTFRYGDTDDHAHDKHYAVGSSSRMACQRGGQHDAFLHGAGRKLLVMLPM